MTDAQFEALGEQMLSIYEEAEQQMLQKVADRLARGVTQPGWAEKKLAQVSQVRAQLQKSLDEVRKEGTLIAREAVTTAYDDSMSRWVAENKAAVNDLGVAKTAPMALKVANIMSEMTDRIDAAERQVLRRFDDAYADVIGKTSAFIAAGTYTQKEALQRAMTDFADEGIDSFTDVNGHHWNLASYAEMALLTAIERSSREGYLDEMKEYGYDLAVISSHEGACPICEAWEDVIVSISGKDPDYPSIDEAESDGVFHPRCMHDLYTYYPEIDQGKLRNEPKEIGEPNEEYSARSVQRYMERQVRKYKSRMAASVTAQGERKAYNKVREWQGNLRQLIRENADSALPRKYEREGGRVTMRLQ